MPYVLPDFNLAVDIYSGPWLTKELRVEGCAANLAIGKRVQQLGNSYINTGTEGFDFGITAILLLPKGTDVRSTSLGDGFQDVIEIPAGSSCWYQVSAWEDMALGFPNEYRVAAVAKIWERLNPVLFAGCVWPVPCPARVSS